MKQYLNALNEELARQTYGETPFELYEPIRYIMGLGGKRMRPLLTVMATALYSDDWQKAVKPALAVEIFHNFTLVHDDIMDKAPLRRGKATVHARWNENVAILSGDVMLVKAYEMLAEVADARFKKALFRFNEAACGVCEGQQLDMNFEQRDDVTVEEYLEMIRLKTAVLLGFALELGGIVADASGADCQSLKEIGENIGIGFQLKDDLLDVFGDPEKFGKQVGGDIIANKKTFLLIEALNLASGELKVELEKWLAAKDFDPVQKVKAVTQIYQQLNIKTLAENAMNDYFKKGFDGLAQLQVSEERKTVLRDFAEMLIDRET